MNNNTENKEKVFDDLQKLTGLCDSTTDILHKLCKQSLKIIEAKDKSSLSLSVNMDFNQANNISSSIDNLKKINSVAFSVAKKVESLRQEIVSSPPALKP